MIFVFVSLSVYKLGDRKYFWNKSSPKTEVWWYFRSLDFHLRFRALRKQKLFPNFRCFDIQFDCKIMIHNLWIINLTKKVDYLLTDSLLYQMARDASLFSPHACSSLTRLTKTLKSIYCTNLLCLWNCKPQVDLQVVRKSSQTALKKLRQFYTLHCLHHWEMYYFLPSIIKCLNMNSKCWFFVRFFERFRNKCLYRLKEGNSLTELFVQFALLKYL